MPLAFHSTSHGTVAFGFFNIETHMLLLEDLFFFADRFCRAVIELGGCDETLLEGWRVADVGNLHGAIAGEDLSGFLGATYRVFPFPALPEDFRQRPDGNCNEELVRQLIEPYGVSETIRVRRCGGGGIAIAEYAFCNEGVRALVGYLVRGGMPRWSDDRPPPYVHEMLRSATIL